MLIFLLVKDMHWAQLQPFALQEMRRAEAGARHEGCAGTLYGSVPL